MAGTDTLEPGQQRRPRQRHVADGVQNLVANKFIGEAQQARIHQSGLVQRQGIFQRGAPRQVHRMKAFQFLEEAEGAGGRDEFGKTGGRKIQRECLPPDGGGGKFDLEFVSGPGRGREAGAGVLLADADRLEDLDGFARDILAFAPRPFKSVKR